MLTYSLRAKPNRDHELFFEEFSVIKDKSFNTDGSHNLSVDGAGILPSVNVREAENIKRYLLKKFTMAADRKMRVLDVGAGAGYLQNGLAQDARFEAYSFEGSRQLIPHIAGDKTKYVICDLSKRIDDIRLKKAFDLTTSFEVFEHVHKSHIHDFIENLIYLSDYHLCSIHVANNEHEQHCTIMPLEKWLELFSGFNISSEVLGYYPISSDLGREEMRNEAALYHWDCSVFLLLNFKLCQ